VITWWGREKEKGRGKGDREKGPNPPFHKEPTPVKMRQSFQRAESSWCHTSSKGLVPQQCCIADCFFCPFSCFSHFRLKLILLYLLFFLSIYKGYIPFLYFKLLYYNINFFFLYPFILQMSSVNCIWQRFWKINWAFYPLITELCTLLWLLAYLYLILYFMCSIYYDFLLFLFFLMVFSWILCPIFLMVTLLYFLKC
jgi:hypothetical protein